MLFMRSYIYVFIFLSLLNDARATGADIPRDPPETVSSVEIPRYLGKWYEIKRMPNSFQDNSKDGYGVCKNTIAEYAERGQEKLSVQNTCYRYNSQNEELIDIAKAKGRVVEGSNNAKLKVNFTGIFLLNLFGIGDGDYWILGLGPVNKEGLYSWAFVGAPKRNFGWILSRTQTLAAGEEKKIEKIIIEKGYSPDSFKSFNH